MTRRLINEKHRGNQASGNAAVMTTQAKSPASRSQQPGPHNPHPTHASNQLAEPRKEGQLDA